MSWLGVIIMLVGTAVLLYGVGADERAILLGFLLTFAGFLLHAIAEQGR